MSKKKFEAIDRFLDEAETYIIPEEFISAACITNVDGDEYLVSFDEAAEILNNGPLREQGIQSVRAIIDMQTVRQTVYELSENILKHTKF